MPYRLACFDVDGTLIESTDSIWATLHRHFGVSEEMRREGMERYKRGEFNYNGWAEWDIRIWRQLGASKAEVESALSLLRLFPGTRETLLELKRRGLKLAVISGGIELALERLLPEHRRLFDAVRMFQLHFHPDGSLHKATVDEAIDEDKSGAFLGVCRELSVEPGDAVFVGDHDNDAQAMELAGLAIAFCPNGRQVRQAADVVIETRDLRAILPYICGSSATEAQRKNSSGIE